MSSTANTDVPATVATVAGRYRRLERVLSVGIALVTVAAVLGAFLFLPYLVALFLSLGAVVVVRLPLLRTGGTLRLETDATAEDVRRDFESATPPVLPFQWALADTVQSTTDGGAYEFSYLFGRRSTTMTTEFRPVAGESESDADFELVVRAGDRPWGTYLIALAETEETTRVEIEVESDRRYGITRLTQWVAASRYQPAAYAAQGYALVDRNRSLRV